MIRIITAALVFVTASLGIALGQQIGGPANCRAPFPAEPVVYLSSTSVCPGQSMTFFVCTGTDCGTMSNYRWSFSPAPLTSANTTTSYAQATWDANALGSYAQVTATVSYSCSTGSNSSYTAYVTIYPAPSATLSITTPAPYCGGINMVATGSNVGASNNVYDFTVTNVSTGQVSSYSTSQGAQASNYFSDLSAGNYTASVSVTPSSSGGSGCFNTGYSSPISFTVQPTVQPTLTLSGPTSFCLNTDTQAPYHAVIDNLYGGQASYFWDVNGSYSENNSPALTLYAASLPANVTCTVVITGNTTPACFAQPVAKSVTTNITGPVTPVMSGITTPQDNSYYCTGDPITFTAVGQNLYGNPTYSWSVDNIFFGNTPSNISPPIPTNRTASSGIFGPNSSISVSVSGFSGACFASYPVAATGFTRTGVPINIRPQLTGVPIPNSAVCSGSKTNIGLNSDTNGTTYTWTQNATLVSVSSDDNPSPSVVPLIAQTLTLNPPGAALGTVYYTVTPNANGCIGSPQSTTISVNPTPTEPSFASNGIFTVCGPGSVLLSAQVGNFGTEVHWFDAPTNGNYLGNTNSLNTSVNTSSYFYASSYNSSTTCESGRLSAHLIVTDRYNVVANSIISQQALIDGLTPTSNLNTLPPQNVQQNIQYFDGLGRLYQDVFVNGSPLQNDLVRTSVYDSYGREYEKYLPVATGKLGCPQIIDNNGNYTAGPALYFYNNGAGDKIVDDSKPLVQTMFELSPLKRVLKQGAPGLNWQPDADPNSISDHTIKYHYEFNGVADVMYFNYDPTSGLLSQPGYYNAGTLQAIHTTDENGNEMIEYVDKLSHSVCKKVQYSVDGSGNKIYASTYYIFDDFGNLAVVLQPEAIRNILGN